MVLYVRPGAGQARGAWIVGRKVGSAVARNRARRLIREAWRTLAPLVNDGNDVVVVARSPFRGAKADDVTREIRSLLVRAGAMA